MEASGVYDASAVKDISPIMIRAGIAIIKNPLKTIPIRITGRKIRVKRIFVSPHAPLRASTVIFPITANMQMIKNNVNIYIPSFIM